MFKFDIQDTPRQVSVTIDGDSVTVPAGTTVAAALLEQHERFRTSPVTGEARSPHCLMGVCYECLVEIDGIKNRQACMEEVTEGMQIQRQLFSTGENA